MTSQCKTKDNNALAIDIWRAAKIVIEMYGNEAPWRAGLRADHLLSQGDVDGFHAWVRISKAIEELMMRSPSGKLLH